MESEKVKEIKEKLQEEIFIANRFGYNLRKVPTEELEKILTLINELESENEELKQHKRELQDAKQDLTKRIAELKKEKIEQLKQFAESICRELWDVRVDSNGEQFKCGDLTSKDVWRIAKQYLVEEGKAQ